MNARERMNRELTREVRDLRLPHGLTVEAALLYTENDDRKRDAACTYGHAACAALTGGPCLEETLGELAELGLGVDDDWRATASRLERLADERHLATCEGCRADVEAEAAHDAELEAEAKRFVELRDPRVTAELELAADEAPVEVDDAFAAQVAQAAPVIAAGLVVADRSLMPEQVAGRAVDYADALVTELARWRLEHGLD